MTTDLGLAGYASSPAAPAVYGRHLNGGNAMRAEVPANATNSAIAMYALNYSHVASRRQTHGSNRAAWASSTAPDVVVFSAGARFFHPRCTAMNRFSTAAETVEHDVRCGYPGSYAPLTRTRRAHFMTEVSGTIIVTSNGRSPMMLHCTRSSESGVAIAH